MQISLAPKPFVFVLMPFHEDFNDIYQLGIKRACEDAGAYCERVDEQIFDETILQRIFNQISKADFIVADMTGRNPNVFYEAGYAHALGKTVILLTQNVSDIPFDLKHYTHIVYERKITKLAKELERRLRWFIENPASSDLPTAKDLEFFFGGSKFDEDTNPEFKAEFDPDSRHKKPLIRFKIDVHNSTERTIDLSNYEFGIISPPGFEPAVSFPSSQIDKDHKIILLRVSSSLLPNSWRSLAPNYYTDLGATKSLEMPISYKFSLQVLTPLGARIIPFTVKFDKSDTPSR